MSLLTETQIAEIVQYWEQRESLEKEILQLAEKSASDEGREYKLTASGFKRANRQIDAQIEELKEQMEKLNADYEKWVIDVLGLELGDRDQDEFTYNLLNTGVKISV